MAGAVIITSLIVIGLALYWSQQPCLKGDPLVVETGNGAIQGLISKSRDGRDFIKWLGIPYAQPPVGALRFESPVPLENWEGVRDGSKYGEMCLQLDFFSGDLSNTIGDEDCLFLNVFRPHIESDKPLAVMVFIHGGAFQVGSSNTYLPEYFMDEDVILVTINYRLTALGFLTTGDEVIRGNMGLKDQSLALKWIKSNIEAFGGNPEKITIFGESAGAASVHYQVLSPMSQGLFNKAISQSAVASNSWAYDSTEDATEYSRRFAQLVSCPSEDSKRLADCLKGKSASELMLATKVEMDKDFLFYPHRDGHCLRPTMEAVDDDQAFLVEHPLDIVKAGKAQRIPWMTGVLSEEGVMTSVAFYKSPKDLASFEKSWTRNVFRSFGIPNSFTNATFFATKVSDRLRKLYFPSNVTTTQHKLDQYTKLFSDSLFVHHLSSTAEMQRQFSPVYLFYYSRRGGPTLTHIFAGVELEERDYGVCHGDELAMLFPMPGIFEVVKDDSSQDYKFSKDMVKLWTDFANDEERMEFRGTELKPQPREGPLQYLELAETSKIIGEPFKDRTDVLSKLNLINLR